jgi:Sulfotransferase family
MADTEQNPEQVAPTEAESRDLRRFRPVFVLSPARSCSSLVAAMLGQHPSLYGFPELRLFRVEKIAQLLTGPPAGQGMPARDRAAGLVRAVAQLHTGHQTRETVDEAFRWLEERSALSVWSVFDHLLELVSPRTGVEKSPETSLTDEALDRAASAYPSARFIHLVRHPWSTVASMIESWSKLNYWRVDRAFAPEYCLELWRTQHSRILAFGASLGPDRFIRVRAEDVVNQPHAHLPPICRWLGINDGPESIEAMLRPERSCYAAPGPANAYGGFDSKFLRAPEMRPVALPAPWMPSHWRVDPGPLFAAVELAQRFGYEAAPDPGPAIFRSTFGCRHRRARVPDPPASPGSRDPPGGAQTVLRLDGAAAGTRVSSGSRCEPSEAERDARSGRVRLCSWSVETPFRRG